MTGAFEKKRNRKKKWDEINISNSEADSKRLAQGLNFLKRGILDNNLSTKSQFVQDIVRIGLLWQVKELYRMQLSFHTRVEFFDKPRAHKVTLVNHNDASITLFFRRLHGNVLTSSKKSQSSRLNVYFVVYIAVRLYSLKNMNTILRTTQYILKARLWNKRIKKSIFFFLFGPIKCNKLPAFVIWVSLFLFYYILRAQFHRRNFTTMEKRYFLNASLILTFKKIEWKYCRILGSSDSVFFSG